MYFPRIQKDMLTIVGRLSHYETFSDQILRYFDNAVSDMWWKAFGDVINICMLPTYPAMPQHLSKNSNAKFVIFHINHYFGNPIYSNISYTLQQ